MTESTASAPSEAPDRPGLSLGAKLLLILIVLVSAASITFHVLSRNAPEDPNAFGPRGFGNLFGLVFAAVGALILSRRSRNPIGWAFLATAMLSEAQDLGDAYGRYVFDVLRVESLVAALGVWFEYWVWVPLVGIVVTVLAFLFPSGRFLSHRWKPLFWVAMAGILLASLGQVFDPRALDDHARPNPIGLGVDPELMMEVGDIAPSLLGVALLLGVIALTTRFRRSVGDERRQLLWLLSAISLVFACLVIFAVLTVAGVAESSGPDPFFIDAIEILMIISIISIPISAAAAILKYGLYSIEVAVNRAVVYGALAVLVSLIYGLAVLLPAVLIFGLGGGQLLLPLVATAIIALAVQPLRRRLQRFANRLVYGERLSPYEAMADLSQRMAGELSIDEVLPRLAETAAKGVAATKSRVVLIMPGGDERTATWPEASQDGAYQHTVPVMHKGDRVGEIAVAKTQAEPITPPEKKLLQDLASQAGLALANVRLTEDLRASRRRIVSAQDDERRRLERDLHDGAQQHLVALKLKIGLAGKLTQSDPAKASEMLAQLEREADETLQNVRDLARGIFPPLLADQGIVAALSSQANKLSASLDVKDEGVGRFSPDVEAAVYFCCLEALQNISKYAHAKNVEIRLWTSDKSLNFSVLDDGVGFDPLKISRGSGLRNMRDRIEALGGEVTVHSSPGAGTRVEGRVPAVSLATVASASEV